MTTCANVTLQISVSGNGSWGDDCTMKQIRRQATESAVMELSQILSKSKYKIHIKSAEVTAVIHDIGKGNE